MTARAGVRLLSVNVVHELIRGPTRWTAIDKRPVAGRVDVGQLGLVGDQQCDERHHGGPDKAVYAYASEDAAWWAEELGREIPPGLFGENLTTVGLDSPEHVWASGGASALPGSRCVRPELPAATCRPGWRSRDSIAASPPLGARARTSRC